MSHDHDLRCEACDAEVDPGGCFDYKLFRSRHGDGLVELAASVRVLHEGVGFGCGGAWSRGFREVAEFVAEHAPCNAFLEAGWSGCRCGPGDTPIRRRILVKGTPEPACGTCLGRRVVPCDDCP